MERCTKEAGAEKEALEKWGYNCGPHSASDLGLAAGTKAVTSLVLEACSGPRGLRVLRVVKQRSLRC